MFIVLLLIVVIALGAVLIYVVSTNNNKAADPLDDASVTDTTDEEPIESGESLERFDTDFYVEEGLPVPTDTTNL